MGACHCSLHTNTQHHKRVQHPAEPVDLHRSLPTHALALSERDGVMKPFPCCTSCEVPAGRRFGSGIRYQGGTVFNKKMVFQTVGTFAISSSPLGVHTAKPSKGLPLRLSEAPVYPEGPPRRSANPYSPGGEEKKRF